MADVVGNILGKNEKGNLKSISYKGHLIEIKYFPTFRNSVHAIYDYQIDKVGYVSTSANTKEEAVDIAKNVIDNLG